MGRRPRVGIAVALIAVLGGLLPLALPRPAAAATAEVVLPDIHLSDVHQLSGRITGPGATPVFGAMVRACETGGFCRSSTAPYSGRYTITGLIDGIYKVRVTPPSASPDLAVGWYTPGGPVVGSAAATPIDVAGADVTDIDLELAEGHRIAGTVTGAGVGPLAGVQVTANGPAGTETALTDGAGSYVVRGLADGTYGLRIAVPNTLNHRSGAVVGGGVGNAGTTPTPIVVAGADVTGQDVISPVGRRMAGRVTIGTIGARFDVIAVSASGERRTTSDADGHWIIRGLQPGVYTVRFEERDMAPPSHAPPVGYWAAGSTLSPDPDDAAPVDLTSADSLDLDARAPTLPQVNGSTGVGAYVRLCGSDPACVVQPAGGSFSIKRVPTGTTTMEGLNGDYVNGFLGVGGYPTDEEHAIHFPVAPASTTQLPGFALVQGGEIRGRVLGDCDCPLPGIRVSTAPGSEPGTPWSGGTAVTKDGTFRLRGLPPGEYTIVVDLPDGSWTFGYYDADVSDRISADPADATAVVVPGPTGHSYVPITPSRILDSRTKVGVLSPFVRNVWQAFQVAGVGGVPPNAVAITGNLTVTGQTSSGYATLAPTYSTPTSTLNFPKGDTRANNVTMPLSSTGQLQARVWADQAHLILDVTGYFLPGAAEATYTPLGPVRVMDSRPATRVGVSGGFLSGAPRTITVGGANGIPADAVAVTANLTVVGQSAGGYLAVTPTATTTPSTSTLNFPKGDTRANGLTAPLDPSGRLAIVYQGPTGASTHAILDVTGYYTADPGGMLYHPIQPGRVLDTRADLFHSVLVGRYDSGTPRTLAAAGHFLIPPTVGAITGNLTVVGPTGGGYVSATTTPTAAPSTSTLNVPTGDTRANGVTVPLHGGDDLSLVFKSSSGARTHLILDLTGYFASS